MVRTQIQFTEQQLRLLRTAARARGVSIAEVVRSCVDTGLTTTDRDRDALYRDALAVAGTFVEPTGATDLASDHDRYLTEALG